MLGKIRHQVHTSSVWTVITDVERNLHHTRKSEKLWQLSSLSTLSLRSSLFCHLIPPNFHLHPHAAHTALPASLVSWGDHFKSRACYFARSFRLEPAIECSFITHLRKTGGVFHQVRKDLSVDWQLESSHRPPFPAAHHTSLLDQHNLLPELLSPPSMVLSFSVGSFAWLTWSESIPKETGHRQTQIESKLGDPMRSAVVSEVSESISVFLFSVCAPKEQLAADCKKWKKMWL